MNRMIIPRGVIKYSSVLIVLLVVLVLQLSSCNNKSKVTNNLSGEHAVNNLVSKRIVSTSITEEDVYTYKIPKTLDFTKELTSNFEKDRPQAKNVDSLLNVIDTEYYDYDSFIAEIYFTKQGLPRMSEKYIDYEGLSLKKVSELSPLEKLTIYSTKGWDVFNDKEANYESRIDWLMFCCMGYYKETGQVPETLWDFGFFRDTVQLEFGEDWKADFDELFTTEPGSASYISPITGEFFSFNNPKYKKGQIYIKSIEDPDFIDNYKLDAGENGEPLVLNQNCWILYYRVYGEDPNTIIKEDFWISLAEDNVEL